MRTTLDVIRLESLKILIFGSFFPKKFADDLFSLIDSLSHFLVCKIISMWSFIVHRFRKTVSTHLGYILN